MIHAEPTDGTRLADDDTTAEEEEEDDDDDDDEEDDCFCFGVFAVFCFFGEGEDKSFISSFVVIAS